MIVLGMLSAFFSSVIGCGFPGSPSNSIVEFSTNVIGIGTIATYKCDRGFELLGPDTRLCNVNNTWSPPGVPFCVINVATGKAAMQSSSAVNGAAMKAIDGSTSTSYIPRTCTMTETQENPWWYVNLLEPFTIQLVRIDFGMSCCDDKVTTVVVRIGNNRPDLATNAICNEFHGVLQAGRPLYFPCVLPMSGAFVSIHLMEPKRFRLSICEVFVYTDQAVPIENCPAFRDQSPGNVITYQGKCYAFYNHNPLSFDESLSFCAQRGGSLISETNPALQGFLSWELWKKHKTDIKAQYWMGAVRDFSSPNKWKWINGEEVMLSFWSVPIGEENCARFDGMKGWLWADANCDSNLYFICQHNASQCSHPDQPVNSTRLITGLSTGSVSEYKCNPGHILIGDRQRRCSSRGFFSGQSPICRYVECDDPEKIANGKYELTTGNKHYGSEVAYTCGDGYKLMGKKRLNCNEKGQWDELPPSCELMSCPEPEGVANGYYVRSTNSTTVGSVVQYFCQKPMFKLVGHDKLVCQQDGTYSLPVPICLRDTYHLFPNLQGQLDNDADGYGTTEMTNFAPTSSVSKITKSTPTLITRKRPGSNFPTSKSGIITKPRVLEDELTINEASVITLGVFSSFVLLVALIATFIMLFRKNNCCSNKKRLHDVEKFSSSESFPGSDTKHLNGFYRKAWDDLMENKEFADIHKKEKSKLANNFGNFEYRCNMKNTEGIRDEDEIVVADGAAYSSRNDKKNHCHRHHHHHIPANFSQNTAKCLDVKKGMFRNQANYEL